MSYSKLHSSIVNSSLWSQSDSTRLLFVTLLAMCDRDGIVYGSKSGISRAANIEPDDIDHAWDTLMSPDQESSDRMRAPENEGRRIEEVPGGFRLLNFEYYRGLRNDDERREQNRLAQARFKARNQGEKVSHGKPTVSHGNPPKATVSHGNPPKAHTEAEADTDTEEPPSPSLRSGDAPPSRGKPAPVLPFGSQAFTECWENWRAHRREIRKPLKPTSERQQLKKLAALGESRAIAAIEHSLSQGYQGIYEEGSNGNGKNEKPKPGPIVETGFWGTGAPQDAPQAENRVGTAGAA